MNIKNIVQDYKNKMYTKDIVKKYNISWEKLTKILKEEKVYKKNNSLLYSDEIVKSLKSNYGIIPNNVLAKQLGISEDWLISKVKTLGLELVGSGFKNKPLLNLVNRNSQPFKYFLGWLAADGNVSKDYRIVNLAITDKEIIYKFHVIFPEGNIYTTEIENQKTLYKLAICSVLFGKELTKYGIVPNKTRLLSIDKEFICPDLVRGYFEGDGHVRNTKNSKGSNRYEAGFVCASDLFTQQLTDYLKNFNVLTVVKKENDSYYRIRISGKENLFRFYKLIYINCNEWYLDRKKQILDLLFSNE